jgi:hypothetical protein
VRKILYVIKKGLIASDAKLLEEAFEQKPVLNEISTDDSAAAVVVTPVVLWQIASHPGIFELVRLWTNELWRLISREGRAGTRMIRMSAARHCSANSAARPHRYGHTVHIQCYCPVT